MATTDGDKAQDKFAEGKPSTNTGGAADNTGVDRDTDVTVSPNSGMTSSGTSGGGFGKTTGGDDTSAGTGGRSS